MKLKPTNMKLLEVPAALQKATLNDLFVGETIKNNTTIFYRSLVTGELEGPYTIYENGNFDEIYHQMNYGMIGVIKPITNDLKNTFIFDLVLCEATAANLRDALNQLKQNQLYYTYINQNLQGPFYIDNSSTSLYVDNLLSKKQVFVINKRQHFKNKEHKEAV